MPVHPPRAREIMADKHTNASPKIAPVPMTGHTVQMVRYVSRLWMIDTGLRLGPRRDRIYD